MRSHEPFRGLRNARAEALSVLAAGVLAMATAATEAATTLVGSARAADGDSIDIGEVRIRLEGIDAPELDQRCRRASGQPYGCGRDARAALRTQLEGRRVRCESVAKDRYGRPLAHCSVRDVGDLGSWLVRRGHALAYRRFSQRYVTDEDYARERRLGVWQGEFERPWDYRRRAPSPPVNVQPLSLECRIKGNISTGGKRIYHVPGDRHYAKTRISTKRGERWFCSEQEARTAGWRRTRR